jgi:hypothetical protein
LEEDAVEVRSIRLRGIARQLRTAQDDTRNHFTRLVAPWLAGLTIPPIAQLALTPRPWQPWHEASLSLFIVATALFLAGYQLSIGSLYRDARPWNEIRAALTFGGLVSLTTAIMTLVVTTTGVGLSAVALAVLASGVAIPIGLRIAISVMPHWKGWTRMRLAEQTGPDRTDIIDEVAVDIATGD